MATLNEQEAEETQVAQQLEESEEEELTTEESEEVVELTAESINIQYNTLIGKFKNTNGKNQNERWNKQFPKKYRVDPERMTKDPEGVQMLDNVANDMIQKGKLLFGTKYREKAVLFHGETFGWDHEETQKRAYRMLMEKNELGIKVLAEGLYIERAL